jgi:hypothetical protein
MTKDEVLKAGVTLASKIGLINVSRRNLCEAIGIPFGSWDNAVECSFTEIYSELKERIGTTNTQTITKKRVDPELRKDHILNAAIRVAEKVPFNRMSRAQVAEEAGVADALVSKHFGTMEQLRGDVVRRAIKQENLKIIAQAIAAGHRHAKKVDGELKARALQCLI